MKAERIRERLRPLLQPLREAVKTWPDYNRTWSSCATSVGETFVHAVAAMVVTRNARLGDERLVQAALEAVDQTWLADLAREMIDHIAEIEDGRTVNPRLRSIVFADQNGHRYGGVCLKTTRAQISVFGAGRDDMPMWLSRRSLTPILDPDTVHLTEADCDACIQKMRRELVDAGVGIADSVDIEIGRCFSGYTFIPDASTRTIRNSWSNDATAISVRIPGSDLARPSDPGRSVAQVDAYAIVHGPEAELTKRLRWHAKSVAGIMTTRDELLSQVPTVRQMIADAGRSKGAPEGGIIQECTITQAGKALQVECSIIGYDPDSFRRKVSNVTFQGATSEEVAKAATPNLERACADYGRHFKRTGRPPCTAETASEVNLDAYRIDKPLVRLIGSRLPDRLQEILTSLIVKGETPQDVRPGFPGPMNGVSIHLEKGCIRGYFDLSGGVSWRGGKIRLGEVTLPQSMRTSITGEPVVDVVRHPFFDCDLSVTSTSTRNRSGGGQVTYLHVGNATAPLAEALCQE